LLTPGGLAVSSTKSQLRPSESGGRRRGRAAGHRSPGSAACCRPPSTWRPRTRSGDPRLHPLRGAAAAVSSRSPARSASAARNAGRGGPPLGGGVSRRVVANRPWAWSPALGARPELPRLLAGESGVAPLPPTAAVAEPVRASVRGSFDPPGHPHRRLRSLLQPSGASPWPCCRPRLDGDRRAGFFHCGGRRRGYRGPVALGRSLQMRACFGSVSTTPSGIYVRRWRARSGRTERFSRALRRTGWRLVVRSLIVKGPAHAALCGIAIRHGIRGPNGQLATARPPAGKAVDAGRRGGAPGGEVEVAVAGGSDCLLQRTDSSHSLRERRLPGRRPRPGRSPPRGGSLPSQRRGHTAAFWPPKPNEAGERDRDRRRPRLAGDVVEVALRVPGSPGEGGRQHAALQGENG